MSGSMELPTSSETVGWVAVYLADMKSRVACVCFEDIEGVLQEMWRVSVMARLGVSVWWW